MIKDTKDKPVCDLRRFELLNELAYHTSPEYYRLLSEKPDHELRALLEYYRYQPAAA